MTVSKNCSKNGIAKVPSVNVSALTQKINAVRECLAESKVFPRKTPVHVLIELTWFSVPEFVDPFELIINNKRVMQMKYDGATINNKRNLERV